MGSVNISTKWFLLGVFTGGFYWGFLLGVFTGGFVGNRKFYLLSIGWG